MQNDQVGESAPEQSPSPLRTVRLARGLSLRDAAHQAGIDPGHLSKVERREKSLGVDALYRLAVLLDLVDLAAALKLYLPVGTRQ